MEHHDHQRKPMGNIKPRTGRRAHTVPQTDHEPAVKGQGEKIRQQAQDNEAPEERQVSLRTDRTGREAEITTSNLVLVLELISVFLYKTAVSQELFRRYITRRPSPRNYLPRTQRSTRGARA